LALFFALTAVGQTGALLDEKSAELEARGAAAADIRAPSAQVARVKAERSARTAAEKKLAAALQALGKKDGIDKLLESAVVSDEQFGSDGSVELKLRLSVKGLNLKK
jgi:hypothetical protein